MVEGEHREHATRRSAQRVEAASRPARYGVAWLGVGLAAACRHSTPPTAQQSTRIARHGTSCAERAETLDTPRTTGHHRAVRAAEREDRVVSLLRTHGRVSVEDLASEVGVTTSTIRRDLQRLSHGGRVVRTYGGAAIPGTASGRHHRPCRAGEGADRRCGRRSLVEDGSTIVVASGSTTLAFARHLVDREDLTVITNALDVAWTLVDRPGIDLIVLGGAIRPGMHSMLGHLTEMAIAGAAGGHAVRRHRRDQPRPRADERLGAGDRVGPGAAADGPDAASSSPTPASSTWSRRPTSSGSTRSTRS